MTDELGRSFSERTMVAGVAILQNKSHAVARDKGWWDEERNFGELVALIHSEASELLEAGRHGNPPSDHVHGISAEEEELADIVIRCADFAESRGFDLGTAIMLKMRFNESRSHKHGGKKF